MRRVITKSLSQELWDKLYRFYLLDPVDNTEFLLESAEAERVKNPELHNLKFIPVGPLEFLVGKKYLNRGENLYPKLVPYFVEMNCGDYVEVVLTGSIGCWPGEAEVLTPTGWVRLDSWDGQAIAEYDPNTEQIDYRIPEEYVVKPSDGWWTFRRSAFEQKVSPEHKFLLKGMGAGATKIATASQLASGEVNPDSYKIPSTFKLPEGPGISLTDNQIRLMVAVLADGNFHPNLKPTNPRCRMGLRKERKKQRLENLLNEEGIPWHTNGPYPKRPTEVTYLFDAPIRTKKWDIFWGVTPSS